MIRTSQLDKIDAAFADVQRARGDGVATARAQSALRRAWQNASEAERCAWASRANRRDGC